MSSLTAAPLPDDFDFLQRFMNDLGLMESRGSRGGYRAYDPAAIGALLFAVLGDAIRHSETVEGNERSNRRTQKAWGFMRLNERGHWTLVPDSYLVCRLAREHLDRLLQEPDVQSNLSVPLVETIKATMRGPMQQRKGSIVTALIEFKQSPGVEVTDSERMSWLVGFLSDHFDGPTPASSVSKALKVLEYPYGFDGGEVKALALEALEQSRLPQSSDGIEYYPFGSRLSLALEPLEIEAA
jgi:hypothetical protein